MKLRIERNNKKYDIVAKQESKWAQVIIDNIFFALCMDRESAAQVIYTEIKKDTGACEFLSRESFRKVR